MASSLQCPTLDTSTTRSRSSSVRSRVRSQLRSGRFERTSNASEKKGRVYLIGAGPGDPDLITVKGLRAIQQADVVVHDRLISDKLLQLIPQHVQRINVGKKPKHHRMPQEEISKTLVRLANAGQQVVRLKGGDPFVFGRGHEELAECRKAGVKCELVPGISSALAGPMSAGIPVTLRGVARSFLVMTAEVGRGFTDPNHDFDSLAKVDTLVILMGRRKLAHLAEQLVIAGRNPDTPVACIENATTDHERVVTGTLETIALEAEHHQLQSPMVTVIGQVATLASMAGNGDVIRGAFVD